MHGGRLLVTRIYRSPPLSPAAKATWVGRDDGIEEIETSLGLLLDSINELSGAVVRALAEIKGSKADQSKTTRPHQADRCRA